MQSTAAVVPGLDFSDVDISKLTVGFEFEFASATNWNAFAKQLGKKNPSWKIGTITQEYGGLSALDYSSWNITGDGSITTDDKRPFDIELISPVLKLSEVPSVLSSVFSLLKELKCRTDDSCSMHVTFGHPKISTQSFDPIKFGVFMQEDKILARFGRSDNEYAVNLTKEIFLRMGEEMAVKENKYVHISDVDPYQSEYNWETDKPNKFSGPAVTDANLDKILTSKRFRRRIVPVMHFTNISLEHIDENRIEVRAIGGDYLNQSQTMLLNLIKHMARCLVVSLSPRLYHSQYILAVRRMIREYADADKTKKENVYIDRDDKDYRRCFMSDNANGMKLEIVHNSQYISLLYKYNNTTVTFNKNSGIIRIMGDIDFNFVSSLLNAMVRAASTHHAIPYAVRLSKSYQTYKKVCTEFPEIIDASNFISKSILKNLTDYIKRNFSMSAELRTLLAEITDLSSKLSS